LPAAGREPRARAPGMNRSLGMTLRNLPPIICNIVHTKIHKIVVCTPIITAEMCWPGNTTSKRCIWTLYRMIPMAASSRMSRLWNDAADGILRGC